MDEWIVELLDCFIVGAPVQVSYLYNYNFNNLTIITITTITTYKPNTPQYQ